MNRDDVMKNIKDLHPNFITDSDGKKLSVILSVEDYENLLEDLEDLAIIAERREEETITHEALVTELKQNGYL